MFKLPLLLVSLQEVKAFNYFAEKMLYAAVYKKHHAHDSARLFKLTYESGRRLPFV